MNNYKIKYFLMANIVLCIFNIGFFCYNINFKQEEHIQTIHSTDFDYIQSIKDDNVAFILKDYIYSDQTRSGNCVFLVIGLTQKDLQQVETNEHRMVGGYRFEFNSVSTGHTSLKIVDRELEVNFQFSSGNDGLGEYDSDAICVYSNERDEVGRFDLKPNDKNGHLISEGIAVSTTSVRIASDVNCKDLQIICGEKKIDVLKNGNSLMLSEYNSEYRSVFLDSPCEEKIVQVKYDGEIFNVDY